MVSPVMKFTRAPEYNVEFQVKIYKNTEECVVSVLHYRRGLDGKPMGRLELSLLDPNVARRRWHKIVDDRGRPAGQIRLSAKTEDLPHNFVARNAEVTIIADTFCHFYTLDSKKQDDLKRYMKAMRLPLLRRLPEELRVSVAKKRERALAKARNLGRLRGMNRVKEDPAVLPNSPASSVSSAPATPQTPARSGPAAEKKTDEKAASAPADKADDPEQLSDDEPLIELPDEEAEAIASEAEALLPVDRERTKTMLRGVASEGGGEEVTVTQAGLRSTMRATIARASRAPAPRASMLAAVTGRASLASRRSMNATEATVRAAEGRLSHRSSIAPRASRASRASRVSGIQRASGRGSKIAAGAGGGDAPQQRASMFTHRARIEPALEEDEDEDEPSPRTDPPTTS